MRTHAVIAVAALALVTAGCGASGATPRLRAAAGTPSAGSGVPPEFRHACGHPHAVVHLKRLPVTVPGARCDLTGVLVDFHGAGAHIQPPGQGVGVAADGMTESHELQIDTAPNGDVRITGD